jgi:hypothetical protein
LVATRLGVDEYEDRREVVARDRLNRPESALVLLLLLLLLLVLVLGLLRLGALLLRGFPEAALEVTSARQLDDPGGRHDDGDVGPELALLPDALDIEAGLAVVVGTLAPAAAHRDYLLRGEAELRLEGLAAVGALALLRAPVDPVMIRHLLLPVLAYPHVPKARLAGEVEAAGADRVGDHPTGRAFQPRPVFLGIIRRTQENCFEGLTILG